MTRHMRFPKSRADMDGSVYADCAGCRPSRYGRRRRGAAESSAWRIFSGEPDGDSSESGCMPAFTLFCFLFPIALGILQFIQNAPECCRGLPGFRCAGALCICLFLLVPLGILQFIQNASECCCRLHGSLCAGVLHILAGRNGRGSRRCAVLWGGKTVGQRYTVPCVV